MTDAQLYLTLGVPVLFNALLIGIFTNGINKRIEDMRDLFRAELAAALAEQRALIERNHSETLGRLAEIDGRLTRLENERRILQ